MKHAAFSITLFLLLIAAAPAGAFELFGDPYTPAQIPVRISAERQMAPQCSQDYGPYIRAGTTWNRVSCSFFEFRKNGIRRKDAFACDGFNHIEFAPLEPGVAAITAINCSSGRREAGTIYNSRIDWNCSGSTAFNEIDLETVSLHEFGHVLGLGHSQDSRAVMHAVYNGPQRRLAFDDEDGICFLYPRGSFGDEELLFPAEPSEADADEEILEPTGAVPGEERHEDR